MTWLDGITDSMDMSLSKLRYAWHAATRGLQRVGHDWETKQQQTFHHHYVPSRLKQIHEEFAGDIIVRIPLVRCGGVTWISSLPIKEKNSDD